MYVCETTFGRPAAARVRLITAARARAKNFESQMLSKPPTFALNSSQNPLKNIDYDFLVKDKYGRSDDGRYIRK